MKGEKTEDTQNKCGLRRVENTLLQLLGGVDLNLAGDHSLLWLKLFSSISPIGITF